MPRALGNTPAVCRKAYVHPAVLETYTAQRRLPGRTRIAKGKRPSEGLSSEERFALRFVEGWEKKGEPLDQTLKRSLKAARRQGQATVSK